METPVPSVFTRSADARTNFLISSPVRAAPRSRAACGKALAPPAAAQASSALMMIMLFFVLF